MRHAVAIAAQSWNRSKCDGETCTMTNVKSLFRLVISVYDVAASNRWTCVPAAAQWSEGVSAYSAVRPPCKLHGTALARPRHGTGTGTGPARHGTALKRSLHCNARASQGNAKSSEIARVEAEAPLCPHVHNTRACTLDRTGQDGTGRDGTGQDRTGQCGFRRNEPTNEMVTPRKPERTVAPSAK